MADCCSYLFWYWLGVHLKNKQEIIISILKDCGAKVRPTGSSKVPTNSKTGGSRFDVESKQNEKPNYHLKIIKWTSVYQRSATRWWTRSARRWWRQSARWAIGDLIHCVRWPLCTVAQQNEMHVVWECSFQGDHHRGLPDQLHLPCPNIWSSWGGLSPSELHLEQLLTWNNFACTWHSFSMKTSFLLPRTTFQL